GEFIRTFAGHTGPTYCVAFSPDGRRIVSGSWDCIKIWDVATGREILTLVGHTGEIRGVAFSPDGRRIASCSCDKTVRIWDASPLPEKSRCEIRTFPGHSDVIFALAFSSDGCLASASRDHQVILWDAGAGTRQGTLLGHDNCVWGLAFSSD